MQREPCSRFEHRSKSKRKRDAQKNQVQSSSTSELPVIHTEESQLHCKANELNQNESSGVPAAEVASRVRSSHGCFSMIGRRSSMEDAVMVAPGAAADSYDFFAVYDGHGGSEVAEACRDRLHQIVADLVEQRVHGGRGVNWEDVMAVSFMKMDDEVGGRWEEGEDLSKKMVGSAALVVLVGNEELVVANCGDSRAVLCRDGVAVPLSCDHKPDRPDERKRVEAAGGKVLNWNGYRVLGVLAVSRSIGDYYLKPYIISEPEVTVRERTELDEFLVIGSDGLWDVLSNETACEVIRKCLYAQFKRRSPNGWRRGCVAAAMFLAEMAMTRGSSDNISVIVVDLRKA